jgi:hypothetical protein
LVQSGFNEVAPGHEPVPAWRDLTEASRFRRKSAADSDLKSATREGSWALDRWLNCINRNRRPTSIGVPGRLRRNQQPSVSGRPEHRGEATCRTQGATAVPSRGGRRNGLPNVDRGQHLAQVAYHGQREDKPAREVVDRFPILSGTLDAKRDLRGPNLGRSASNRLWMVALTGSMSSNANANSQRRTG